MALQIIVFFKACTLWNANTYFFYLGARRKEERGEEGTGKEEKKKRKRKRSSGHCSSPVDVYPKKGNAHVSSQRQPDQNDPADWSGKFREERKEEGEEASRRDREDRREEGERKEEKHHQNNILAPAAESYRILINPDERQKTSKLLSS